MSRCFTLVLTCIFSLLALLPVAALAQEEIVISKLQPGKTQMRGVFVNQFEGRMAFLLRAKMRPDGKNFNEGFIKYNFRRTGQKETGGKADVSQAAAEGQGTAGVTRYLTLGSLEIGKEYLLDVDIRKVSDNGLKAYPYILDVDVIFADRVVSCAAINGESLINIERKLAGIPEMADNAAVKKLQISDEERAKYSDSAFKVVKDPKEDVFEVGTEVKMKSAPGSGANIVLDSFSHWKGNRMTNIWNRQAGFEPIVFRHMNVVGEKSVSTVDYIEHNYAGGRGGLGFWQTFPTGFWDGGDFEVYRIKGDYYELIHKGKVKKWVVERDKEERLYYDSPAPEATQEGDLYLLTMERDNLPSCLGSDRKTFQGMGIVEGTAVELDAATHAPEGGSTRSLRMALPSGKKGGIEHHFIQDKQGWTRLTPGKKYLADIWMKQEGVAGEVTLTLGHLGSQNIPVGKEWKKYSLSFDYQPDPEKLQQLGIYSSGGGTLWVDNFVVYEEGVEPFRFLPQYQKALQNWKPESLRYLAQGIEFYRTLDSVLQKDFSEKSMFVGKGKQANMGPATAGSLFTLLDAARQVGANPWINTFLLTEEECLGLIEYLGGPANSTYGKIRAEKHGQVEPWTKVFKKIYIEMGNECWNSPVFDPLSFPAKPERHAALANRMYRAMKKSPHYQADKFDFIAGGHSHNPSYTNGMIKGAIEADMLAVANYIGGWDGFTVLGGNDADMFQRQLLYPYQVVAPQMNEVVAARAAQGRAPSGTDKDMGIAIYEYGSGYALPSADRPYIDESEEVGKSLALGIATLDMHMIWLHDFGFDGPQGYFNFQTGINWTSHTDGETMRPFAGWQALELRNRYCQGDLMSVQPKEVKTITIPDSIAMKMNWKGEKQEVKVKGRENVPMVSCYAFQDGKKHSLLLLNRCYSDTRTAKVVLPHAAGTHVSIHRLAYHDPRVTNRDELLYKIESEEKSDFSNNYSLKLPPVSATVLVYEEQ